jgi:hypothetical protein
MVTILLVIPLVSARKLTASGHQPGRTTFFVICQQFSYQKIALLAEKYYFESEKVFLFDKKLILLQKKIILLQKN